MKAVIVEADILTPFGLGVDACRKGLLAGRTAISPLSRFSTQSFFSDYGAIIPDLKYHGETSLVMQMLSVLITRCAAKIPADTQLLLATTKGEIDILEQCILTGSGDPAASSLQHLLRKVIDLTGVTKGGAVISAACTSSSAAAGQAAALIRNGRADSVLVVACDAVTEFVFSGFSSLMALDKGPARPFDKNRAGLSVGEAAAFMLLMSRERAVREGRPILGEVAGWGMSDDANHMTGPSRESEGLVRAINAALKSAGISADQVDFISAHGTGTQYNDAMEIGAFHTVFNERILPVYSIKGGIGHTMGAAGLVEAIIALRSQQERVVPPTANLEEVADGALGRVSPLPQPIVANSIALVTNAGFSGVNTALVLM